MSSGFFTSARLQLECLQHVRHNTAGVRNVRHMHQRGPVSSGMETRYGHDRLFGGTFDQTYQFDVDEKMFELCTGITSRKRCNSCNYSYFFFKQRILKLFIATIGEGLEGLNPHSRS